MVVVAVVVVVVVVVVHTLNSLFRDVVSANDARRSQITMAACRVTVCRRRGPPSKKMTQRHTN